MRTLHVLLALACGFQLTSTADAQSSSRQPVPDLRSDAPALIRPGDAVQITVWRKPELSGEFFVAADGAIAHPFYQDVNVAGVPIEVATERVQRFLEAYESSPRVRLDPLYRVSVSGHVRQPKLYSLRPEYTISEAIDEAGGPIERGRVGAVRLYRNGEVYRLHLEGGDATASTMQIQSGDRIVLEQRSSIMRDVVFPTVSFVGSVASLVHIWLRYRR